MPDLVITGAEVLRDGCWVVDDVVVRDGAIAAGPSDGPDVDTVDAGGLRLVPGFVDLQCNGALGHDLTARPERLWDVASALPRWGVTAWLPTIVTAARGAIDDALAVLAAGPPPGWRGAVPLGLHLEGPFLSPAKRGAHRAEHLRPPSLEESAGWSRATGVALVTLAPDLDGADDVLRALVGRGVVVSLGHSPASAEVARAGVDAGAGWVTHLFNAMGPLHHREPGLAGVALTDDRIRVGLIADGLHVHPDVVALAQRALGARLTLVTDAAAPMGLAPPDPAGIRLSDGTLAGSDLTMDRAIRNLVAFTGCPVEVAIAAATAAPTAVLADATRGTLSAGARGDLVLLDRNHDVVATWVGGELIHGKR